MNWFESWFDSKYYHILYKNRDKEEAEYFLDNLVSHLSLIKDSKIIDIGCGKGRHAYYLNSLGFDVTGIDLSYNSIKTAKSNTQKKLKFATHDMRTIYKEGYYDVSLNLFTSFGYFSSDQDDKNTIISMAENLKNNGLLIIDFMNAKKVMKNLMPNEIKVIEGIKFIISRKIEKKRVVKSIQVLDDDRVYNFQEKVKLITYKDFKFLFKLTSLKITDTFGDYKLNSFNEKSSDRLIMVCQKS